MFSFWLAQLEVFENSTPFKFIFKSKKFNFYAELLITAVGLARKANTQILRELFVRSTTHAHQFSQQEFL